MHELLDGARRGLVHHLEPGRNDARRDDRWRPPSPAFSTSSNAAMTTCARLRLRQQLDGHFGDHAEHALGADDEREQVVAGASSASPPSSIDSPSIVTAAHAQHVVHGEAVLQAVHAARVLGDVAADRAGDLTDGSGA